MLSLAEIASPKPCLLTPAGWFMGTFIMATLGFLFSKFIKRLFKRRPLRDGEKNYRLVKVDPPKPKKTSEVPVDSQSSVQKA